TAVGFNHTSHGADFWDYDCPHRATGTQTCNFTASGHSSPVASPTFPTAGPSQPCLRVRRGATENNVTVHSFAIVVSQSGPPPAVTVSGLNSGQVNQPYVYSGFVNNC